MRLVDDGGSTDNSPDPPYHPTPTPSNHSPSSTKSDGGRSGGHSGGGHGKRKNGASESTEPLMPLAAQAGLSVGVVGLAALALLPGRRPPADLR